MRHTTEIKEYWIVLLFPKSLFSLIIVVKLSIMFKSFIFFSVSIFVKNGLMNAVTHARKGVGYKYSIHY